MKSVWTEAEDQALKALIEAQLHPQERTRQYAALLPGRSRGAIYNRLQKWDLNINAATFVKRPWTEGERTRIRQAWPTTGVADLAREFGRSSASVGNEARRMGLPAKRCTHRFETTKTLDAAIRAAYGNPKRGACKAVAKQYGVTVPWVKVRAGQLGLNRSVSRYNAPWTPEEDAIIEQWHDQGGAKLVANRLKQRGFIRSSHAVLNRVVALGLSWRNREIYNASELGELMGVDHKTISGWIKWGYLKARRENPTGISSVDEPWYWMIKHQDARNFLIHHVSRYRMASIDRYWLVATLAGDKETAKPQSSCGVKTFAAGGLEEMPCMY